MPKKNVYTIEKELKHHVIEWAGAGLSITGALLNVQHNVSGFYIWAVSNLLWIIFAAKYRHFGLMVMNIIFLAINLVGIRLFAG